MSCTHSFVRLEFIENFSEASAHSSDMGGLINTDNL